MIVFPDIQGAWQWAHQNADSDCSMRAQAGDGSLRITWIDDPTVNQGWGRIIRELAHQDYEELERGETK